LPWVLLAVAGISSACGRSAAAPSRPLRISAIPDQDPEKLQRLYGLVASYLSKELAVDVEYKPVADYKAAVTAFRVGDLDLVWYGGLTGVQARSQVPGAEPILQRDVDERFTSVFIANKARGVTGLDGLKGHTFTFGSESSTSGRLMPQFFLQEHGIRLGDFKGVPGFSGSHDKTVELVAAGTYDAGVLNAKVWQARLDKGTVDPSKVAVIWTTPSYHDYHWVLHPTVRAQRGAPFVDRVRQAFLGLDPSNPEQQAILDLFSAKKFVPTDASNYTQIEKVGREVGLIVDGNK
jgi:phosphonate transport system substrate-binding protein